MTRSNPRPASRRRSNPFLAKARGVHRGKSASLGERDGFHTSSDISLVVPYANLKGSPYTNTFDGEWEDYPVILSLDMTGLERVPDIDAERAAGMAFDYFAGECYARVVLSA